ncbi:Rieske (2Fe-2S) protein [soil metagenome]
MARPPEAPSTTEPLSRRTLVRSAAVGGLGLPLLAACGDDAASPSSGPSSESPTSGDSPTSGGGDGGVSVPQADVPVGGGTIIDQSVVVTQPAEGEFKAFTAICTHQNCPVTDVTDGKIHCDCHESFYSIDDGSVLSGPAPAALEEFSVSVKGSDLVVG